jgi:hypothetical protein
VERLDDAAGVVLDDDEVGAVGSNGLDVRREAERLVCGARFG